MAQGIVKSTPKGITAGTVQITVTDSTAVGFGVAVNNTLNVSNTGTKSVGDTVTCTVTSKTTCTIP